VVPLVGREQELALLLDRWNRAQEGEGQVVLLSGPPGIGKSRLVRALRERLTDGKYIFVSHFCSPFHQTSPLHPIIDILERAVGFVRDDTPPEKLDKLEALLTQASQDVAGVAPLLAALRGRCLIGSDEDRSANLGTRSRRTAAPACAA
jgi:predicted ATPase